MECKGQYLAGGMDEIEIRIVPEWNVKSPCLASPPWGGVIRIVPEWNVKAQAVSQQMKDF